MPRINRAGYQLAGTPIAKCTRTDKHSLSYHELLCDKKNGTHLISFSLSEVTNEKNVSFKSFVDCLVQVKETLCEGKAGSEGNAGNNGSSNTNGGGGGGGNRAFTIFPMRQFVNKIVYYCRTLIELSKMSKTCDSYVTEIFVNHKSVSSW